uniref:Chromosome 22 open reading frame 15 n=1 Tax=Bos mutus grunniens TaxID=30521 RepID=A0A8B9YC97_BOSMU
MFIKVMFGASCWELVNIWCGLGTLTAHLRQSGQVPPDASVALLAEDGHLVSLAEGLEEGPSPAPSVASPPLQEGTYVLMQIISKGVQEGEGGDPTRYECLLENPDGWHPELAGAKARSIPPAESAITGKLHQQEGQGQQ